MVNSNLAFLHLTLTSGGHGARVQLDAELAPVPS